MISTVYAPYQVKDRNSLSENIENKPTGNLNPYYLLVGMATHL